MVDDASHDGTIQFLRDCKLGSGGKYGMKYTILNRLNQGLRRTVIDFFDWVRSFEKSEALRLDMIGIIGNDVRMPRNWLNNMLKIFANSPAQVLSPDYVPSRPARRFGLPDKEGWGFLPATHIVGLWLMYADLISDLEFERYNLVGIKGGANLMEQIKIEKDPIIGWVPTIMAQDIGHWSGLHPDHIKTENHRQYYAEVGRGIKWD